MRDLPGKFVGIILAVILCTVVPFQIIVAEEEMINRRLIVEDMRDYVDAIIDGRVNSDADRKAFESKLASYGLLLDYEIIRYSRSVNPDPLSGDSYYVTYIQMDDITTFNKGDKIELHVYQLSGSTTGNIARRLTGMFMRNFDVRITARVR